MDGCITCPWHGWNYQPGTDAARPPREVLETETLIQDGRVGPRHRKSPGRKCPAVSPPPEVNDDFTSAISKKSPSALARPGTQAALAMVVTGLAALLARAPDARRPGTFEFGVKRTFEGVSPRRPAADAAFRLPGRVRDKPARRCR